MQGLNRAMLIMACLISVGTAKAQVPSQVRIRSISYAGSGCPAGSVAQNVSLDRQSFVLLFDRYVAQLAPGIPIAESRKNCALNLDLEFPAGWSFTIMEVAYRGYVALDAGVVAQQVATYNFQGDMRQASFRTNFRGEIVEDYTIGDRLGLEAMVWSPCQGARRSLTINSQVRILPSANRWAQGLMTVDTIDGAMTQIYGVRWRRC